MRTGRPVNLYLSDETLKNLDELIALWGGKKKLSYSKAIVRLIEEDKGFQEWKKKQEEK